MHLEFTASSILHTTKVIQQNKICACIKLALVAFLPRYGLNVDVKGAVGHVAIAACRVLDSGVIDIMTACRSCFALRAIACSVRLVPLPKLHDAVAFLALAAVLFGAWNRWKRWQIVDASNYVNNSVVFVVTLVTLEGSILNPFPLVCSMPCVAIVTATLPGGCSFWVTSG